DVHCDLPSFPTRRSSDLVDTLELFIFVWVRLPTLAYLPALMTKWQSLVISIGKPLHLPNKPDYRHLDNKESKNHRHLLEINVISKTSYQFVLFLWYNFYT